MHPISERYLYGVSDFDYKHCYLSKKEMKKVLFVLAAAALMVACGTKKAENTEAACCEAVAEEVVEVAEEVADSLVEVVEEVAEEVVAE